MKTTLVVAQANEALRLKTRPDVESTRASWRYFDEKKYVSKKALLPGDDVYVKNKFNQRESDRLPSDRPVPDTRHPQ
jgi:polypeptide N-acetylgalactosaminyltransferase